MNITIDGTPEECRNFFMTSQVLVPRQPREEDLMEFYNSFQEATLSQDQEKLESMIDDNFYFVDPFGSCLDKQEMIRDITNRTVTFDEHNRSEHILKFHLAGNKAVVITLVSMKGTHRGEDVSGCYRDTHTFVWGETGWKLASASMVKTSET